MEKRYRLEQLILFVSTFLLVYVLFFLLAFYSFNFEPDTCAKLNSENTTVELDYSYQEELCGSIVNASKSYFSQTENLKPLLVSLAVAFILTLVYSYYEKLEKKYRQLGV